MNSSKYMRAAAPCLAALLAFCIAAPAAAHPGSLWGIDVSSVVSLRDQARAIAYNFERESRLQEDPSYEEPRLERVRTIVLDPGHGGDNSGATGVAGIAEKYLTLELAYALREALQQKYPHLRVVMTRYWDTSVDFADRVHLANLADADLFLSLHYNAAVHDRALGFETYFLRPEEVTPGQEEVQSEMLANADLGATGIQRPIEGLTPVGHHDDLLMLIQQDLLRAHQHSLSGRLAEVVQDGFRGHLESIDRGVKQANFSVLRGAHMPAVVVEAGFLTHPVEGIEVTTEEHRGQIVDALIEAVEAFDRELVHFFDQSSLEDQAPEEGIPGV